MTRNDKLRLLTKVITSKDMEQYYIYRKETDVEIGNSKSAP